MSTANEKSPEDRLMDDLTNPDMPVDAPLASGSGPSPIIDALLDGTLGWDEAIEADMRVGRPTAGAHAESVQRQFRYPKAWDGYVKRAAKREGTDSMSDYFRGLIIQDARQHGEARELLGA